MSKFKADSFASSLYYYIWLICLPNYTCNSSKNSPLVLFANFFFSSYRRFSLIYSLKCSKDGFSFLFNKFFSFNCISVFNLRLSYPFNFYTDFCPTWNRVYKLSRLQQSNMLATQLFLTSVDLLYINARCTQVRIWRDLTVDAQVAFQAACWGQLSWLQIWILS